MEAFYWLILLTSVFACSHAEPNLFITEEVIGKWRDSVILPCVYVPSPGYVEEEVIWSFGGKTILRVEGRSEMIPLIKYRRRLSLVRAHPGDVSLNISKLQMDDKGQYNCEVIWRSTDTSDSIQKDATIKLNIIRASPATKIPTTEKISTKRPEPTAVSSTTKKPKIEVINTQRPGSIAVSSTTKKPKTEVINTQRPGSIAVSSTTKKPTTEVINTQRPGSIAGEPVLTIREEITGQWRESVIIPCSYMPSTEYVEEVVIWSLGGRTILRLEDSVEHVYLTRNRGRLSLSRSHPGVVSLRINNLQMDDKGQYNCEVIWRSRKTNGKIQKDATIKLNIVKGEPSLVMKEEINGHWRSSVVIPCTYTPCPDYVEEVVIWSFGGRTILRLEDSVEHVYLTKNRGRLSLSRSHPGDISLRINNLQMDDKGQYNCEVMWRSRSTNGKIQKDVTTTLKIIRASWAVATLGIPLYLLILICVLCTAVVATVVIVILITKRRKKLSEIYEVPNMSTLLAREGESHSQVNGGQRCEEPKSRNENEYEPSPGGGAAREGTYEKMEFVKEAEYELLIPERQEKN
ncbi:V-set and immunoglobulin domain-containing protein 4 isoform X2 [Microcaecilia unicolor]|uniref:V-set and immunoglobulin domain-containing protein 4 isoform X2 n=1 Tax=Microcaecilia unicolor TaxID=1415580 RepID=UPI001186FA68|nr:V-set and immunoglobulin domain-containing protein 4 isoform X2 [Microcaecilia unicolor]